MRSRSMLKSFSTASTFYPDPLIGTQQLCERSYLIQKSNLLMHDIHCVQGQKSYYQNQLQTQLRTSTQDKQRLLKALSQKSLLILNLEEQVERQRKQLRLLGDDYLSIKNKLESERDSFNKQIVYLEAASEEKLRELKQKLEEEHLAHIQTVIAEINQSCNKKLKLKDEEIEIVRSSREGVGLELQKCQEEYRLLLVKQSGMASEELHNELRKRDREERDRYNLDVEYKSSIKKQNLELRQEVEEKGKEVDELRSKMRVMSGEISSLEKENQELKGKVKEMSQNQRVERENQPLENQKGQENQELIDTVKIKPGQYIAPSLDLELMASLQSLKQFLDESMMEILVDLFERSSSQGGKVKSNSFNTFQMNLAEIKKEKRELSLVIYTSMKLKQILKQNWAASQTLSQPTLKQSFIRTCLQQSEALKNKPTQQLYRLVQLIHRIRNPINHTNNLVNVSGATLHHVYDKTVGASSKVFY